MTKKEQEYLNGINQDIQVPDIVLSKANEAFTSIRGKKQKMSFKKWMVAGIVAVLMLSTTIVAVAASGYFNKETVEGNDAVTYQFELDYELIPGIFKATPEYLPEGYVAQEEDKYCPEDNWGHGISVLPILNTVELDLLNGELSESDIENVEKTTINGMEAHIITYKSQYDETKYIYLFNPTDGYVMQIFGDSNVPVDELIKFADHLVIERVADTSFASAEEKAAIAEKEVLDEASARAYAEAIEARNNAGIAPDELILIGQETRFDYMDSDIGYTIESTEYFDSISGYDKNSFYDYSEVEPWLNEDGSLKPYTRLTMDNNGNVVNEEKMNQKFLAVKVKAIKYSGDSAEEIPLDATLQRLVLREDGRYTWPETDYSSAPSENYYLQTDNRCIYMSDATNLEGEKRAHSFFWRSMSVGDEVEYTLIFVVDEDMMDSVVLEFNANAGGGSSFDGTTATIDPSTYFSISK